MRPIFTTNGDPGMAVLARLQESIRRPIDKGDLGWRNRRSSIARGLYEGPPEEMPGLNDRQRQRAAAGLPLSGYTAIERNINIGIGGAVNWPQEIQPVSFTFRVTGGAIDAFASPRLAGPIFVHGYQIFYPWAEVDPNTTDILVRIDLSDNATLDAFGYAAGSYPSGASSARDTIFKYATDSGEHLLPGQRTGWLWMQPTGATFTEPPIVSVNRYLDVGDAYVKVYVQQEDVTDRAIRIIAYVTERALR